ncbi:MAG: cell division protein FtsZ [Bacteroidales bacterium]|nr:cell division protein FtsZ [Bacteroidales bacterium]
MDNMDINTTEEQLLDFKPAEDQSSYIKVIGVGGAGTNAVNHMFRQGITGVDFLVCNTDKNSLDASPIKNTLKIGKGLLGAGNNPAVGRQAALDAEEEIKDALSNGTRMLFITAGMGGGTGTGASPEIARIAKSIKIAGEEDEEILVVAVVNTPFSREGKKRRDQAKEGIEELRKVVDAIIVVNTEKLKNRGNMKMSEAFATLDDILLTAVKGISEIMTSSAYMQVDFRDVQSVMKKQGVALMGSGIGEGEERARQAVTAALNNDLLNDDDISKTKNVLYYVTCSSKPEHELTTEELDDISSCIEEKINADVDVIWGYGYDDTLDDKVAITLIATGFESKEMYTTTIGRGNTTQQEEKKFSLKTESTESKDEKIEHDTTSSVVENDDSLTKFDTKTVDIKETPSSLPNTDNVEPIIEKQPEKHVIGTLNLEEFKEETPSVVEEVVAKKEEELVISPKVEITNVATENSTENKEITIVPVGVKEPEPIVEETQEEVPVSLGDLTGTVSPRKTSEQRWERIKRMRDMLSTKSGIAALENHRPTVDNIDNTISAYEEKSKMFAMNNSGVMTYIENPTLNSSVD